MAGQVRRREKPLFRRMHAGRQLPGRRSRRPPAAAALTVPLTAQVADWLPQGERTRRGTRNGRSPVVSATVRPADLQAGRASSSGFEHGVLRRVRGKGRLISGWGVALAAGTPVRPPPFVVSALTSMGSFPQLRPAAGGARSMCGRSNFAAHSRVGRGQQPGARSSLAWLSSWRSPTGNPMARVIPAPPLSCRTRAGRRPSATHARGRSGVSGCANGGWPKHLALPGA